MGKKELKQPKEKKGSWKKKLLILFVILCVLISCVILYARYIGTSGLFIKEYKITNSILTESYHGLKIIHLSDIHYGMTTNEKEMITLVQKVNELKPDLIFLTGDLFDTSITYDDNDEVILSRELNNMQAKMGKYAITGNHDQDSKLWKLVIENGGFKSLDDSYELIYQNNKQPIFIAGLSSSMTSSKTFSDKAKTINDLLSQLESSKNPPLYHILLIHEPDFIDQIDHSKYELILAGHSHNGQVRLPFIGALVLPPNAKKYYKESYQVDNSQLYISSGIGTSNLKFRLFDRPSINFYRLTSY